MTRCACSPSTLTCVRFSGDVVLVRCGAHDVQSWLVDGERVERTVVLELLRDAFGGHRVPAAAAAPAGRVRRPRVVRLPKPAVDPRAGVDDQLTALLRSRGLEGSWAVA